MLRILFINRHFVSLICGLVLMESGNVAMRCAICKLWAVAYKVPQSFDCGTEGQLCVMLLFGLGLPALESGGQADIGQPYP